MTACVGMHQRETEIEGFEAESTSLADRLNIGKMKQKEQSGQRNSWIPVCSHWINNDVTF